MNDPKVSDGRDRPANLTSDEFRQIGHRLIDQIAEFYENLEQMPVRPEGPLTSARTDIGEVPVPETGRAADTLIEEATKILFDKSIFIGHPRFWANINGAGAPLGVLADTIAGAINANLSSWEVGPAGSEIERQAVRWIAELIGFPSGASGILTSGGSMANGLCLHAARRAMLPWDTRALGTRSEGRQARIYATRESHIWLSKLADFIGLGTEAIHWVETDDELRMNVEALRQAVQADRHQGEIPFCVVAAAGTVATGTVDPIGDIADYCADENLWLHIDGAYGAFASLASDVPPDLHKLGSADSIAVDPHKWLYAPFDVGCALVKDPKHLTDAFAFSTHYYNSADDVPDMPVPFRDLGLQTSRSFRALKVWLLIQQSGRVGYSRMISDDIDLARQMAAQVDQTDGLELTGQGLSITTFRYVPTDLVDRSEEEIVADYLDRLNKNILDALQKSGWAYPSQSIVRKRFVIRACIVNFRSRAADVAELPIRIAKLGIKLDRDLRSEYLPN